MVEKKFTGDSEKSVSMWNTSYESIINREMRQQAKHTRLCRARSDTCRKATQMTLSGAAHVFGRDKSNRPSQVVLQHYGVVIKSYGWKM